MIRYISPATDPDLCSMPGVPGEDAPEEGLQGPQLSQVLNAGQAPAILRAHPTGRALVGHCPSVQDVLVVAIREL